jgi:hypothetical protein
MSSSVPRTRIRSAVLVASLATTIAACSDANDKALQPPEATEPTPAPVELCAQAPNERICSFLPQDVIVALPNAYQGISPQLQRPFDQFSWQMFVALNWPASPDGTPLDVPIDQEPDAPRVWLSYATPFEVFGGQPDDRNPAPPECDGVGSPEDPILQAFAKSGSRPEIADFLEATGQPLIDRNLNFAIYDIRMNPIEEAYILENGLETAAGQMAFASAGNSVSFPMGFYADPSTAQGGSPGAIEIKATWRILDSSSGDDPSRYYAIDARVFVPAAESASGSAFCFAANLGLVGFHVIQRTMDPMDGGAKQSWNWATFEHVDNAPEASNAGDPSGDDPGPTVCEPPLADAQRWSFFQAACAGCTTNDPPPLAQGASYLWSPTPPYAAAYATQGQFGTQVVRCWQIYAETEGVNRAFQDALADTVWANYRLINTQWQSSLDAPPFSDLSIPRFLGNPVLETYIQSTADCLGCHSFATTKAGDSANFSFLLSYAQ